MVKNHPKKEEYYKNDQKFNQYILHSNEYVLQVDERLDENNYIVVIKKCGEYYRFTDDEFSNKIALF